MVVLADYLGHEAKVEDFPFLVHLSISINIPNIAGMPKLSHYPCTGSYIKPWWVLTAAICLKNNYNPSGLLGMVPDVGVECRMGILRADLLQLQNIEPVNSEKLFVHSDFDLIHAGRIGLISIHNIGLVRLQKPFEPSSTVGFIDLPTTQIDYSGSVTTAGYNTAKWLERKEFDKKVDLGLRTVTYAIWPKDKCKEMSNRTAKICVGEAKDKPWKFDIGGPLIYQKLLIGIATPRTDFEVKFGTYEDVYTHKEWINYVTRLTPKMFNCDQRLRDSTIIYFNFVILYLINTIH